MAVLSSVLHTEDSKLAQGRPCDTHLSPVFCCHLPTSAAWGYCLSLSNVRDSSDCQDTHHCLPPWCYCFSGWKAIETSVSIFSIKEHAYYTISYSEISTLKLTLGIKRSMMGDCFTWPSLQGKKSSIIYAHNNSVNERLTKRQLTIWPWAPRNTE